MKMLWDKGFTNSIIQQTSDPALCKYNGPCKTLTHLGQSTYDNSMVELKKAVTKEECDYILLLDNDCFLSDINHLTRYITEFVRDDYDFACHLVTPDYYKQHPSNGIIQHYY